MMPSRKLKYFSIASIAFIAILLSACKKNELESGHSGLFLKVLETDSGVVAMKTLALQDGNYLVVCRDKLHEHPGYGFKIDKSGNQVLRKRLSSSNRCIQSVIDLPGNGFATVGYENLFQPYLYVCLYDDDANFQLSKQLQLPLNAGDYSFFRILQLSNGNYAFAAGHAGSSYGILVFTDGEFNKLNEVTFTSPPLYSGYAINALCEMPGNTIAITGSSGKIGASFIFTTYTNMFVLTTDLSGNQKTFTMIDDTLNSETPNFIFQENTSIFSVTSRIIDWENGNGLFVDYEFAKYSSTISGMIYLNFHDSIGNVLDRKQVSSYPLNGMIQSTKPTSDGGYILCGTVNQANTATLVSETKIYLLKINRERNIEWTKTIHTPYPSYGTDVIQTTEGGYLIIGQTNTFNNKFQAVVIKTDAEGNIY